MNTPKPKRESRTIRFSKILIACGLALSTLFDLVVYLVSDPQFAAAVETALPESYRRWFGILVLGIGLYVRHLRMNTSAPIAEKWLSTDVPDKVEPMPPLGERPDLPTGFHR